MKMHLVNALTLSLKLMAICVFFVASNAAHANKADPKDAIKSQSQTMILQNFPVNAEVYYTIFSGSNLLGEGREETDENGALSINTPLGNADAQSSIVYDLKISKDGDYLDVLLRQNLQSGKITTSGKGLDQFSEISILTSDKNMRTKADWSGAFNETSLMSKKTGKEKTFEIALNGFSNLGDMGAQPSPAIIKVLSAPNGGLVTQTPNQTPSLSPPTSGYAQSTGSAGQLSATSSKIVQNYVTALMLMTDQLSAVMMSQLTSIGQFFDAKMQMEVQRTHQELRAQAIKDYHPSEQMCTIGSSVRSLASTEQRITTNKYALNNVMMSHYRNQLSSSSAINGQNEVASRLKQFREVYCNLKDSQLGLWFMCEHDQNADTSDSTMGQAAPDGVGAQHGMAPPNTVGEQYAHLNRINKDVDYTRTLDYPQTVDVDMTDGVEADDEEDVIALAKNLYWPTIINFTDPESLPDKQAGMLDLQRVTALKNMAHTSYTNLVGMKARAETPASGVEPGWAYMKTLLKDFGITEDEIEQMVGVQPSYWAQMDVLTKKMYQMPSFYTNLYDKPVNVERMSVTLDAIKLMQARDYYNSRLRHEMLNSARLETELVNGGHYDRPKSILLFR